MLRAHQRCITDLIGVLEGQRPTKGHRAADRDKVMQDVRRRSKAMQIAARLWYADLLQNFQRIAVCLGGTVCPCISDVQLDGQTPVLRDIELFNKSASLLLVIHTAV